MTDSPQTASDTAVTVKMIIAFLLDETGSMSSVRDATISGFNEYVGTLTTRHPDALLSLRLFSSEKYSTLAQLTPLPLVSRLSYDNYQPAGGTPLYDSIARLIRETEDATAPITPLPEILMVIMTDGEENASREFNRQRIFDLITDKESKGWAFVYLGANQDAWSVGASIGVKGNYAMRYNSDRDGTDQVFNMMGDATENHMRKRMMARQENPSERVIPADDEFFSDDDADKLGTQKPPSP